MRIGKIHVVEGRVLRQIGPNEKPAQGDFVQEKRGKLDLEFRITKPALWMVRDYEFIWRFFREITDPLQVELHLANARRRKRRKKK